MVLNLKIKQRKYLHHIHMQVNTYILNPINKFQHVK